MRPWSYKLIWPAAIICLVFATVYGWPRFKYYQLTGSFYPIHKVESLQSPVMVTNWCSDGLQLEDGRVLQLLGFRRLPTNSVALQQMTKRGVEISKDGEIFGLVQVHHWCGNDPVREHIAKVDIAKALLFLKEGEPLVRPADYDPSEGEDRNSFSQWGWNVSEFHYFEATQGSNK